MHEPGRADAPGAVEHELRAADVHVEQLAHLPGRMDDRGRVHHRRALRRSSKSSSITDGVAHVAGDDLDRAGRSPRAPRRRSRSCTRQRIRRPRGLRRERPHEVLAEPARGAGDDNRRRHDGPLDVSCSLRFAIAHGRRRYRLLRSHAKAPLRCPNRPRPARLAFPCAPSRARRRRRRAPTGRPARDEQLRNVIALTIVALVVALPLRGLFRVAGPAHGRGLHARLPRAGAEGRDPEPRLPAPLRAREPVGARGRVQGVRRLAAQRARLRPRCNSSRSCSASTRSPAAGAGSSRSAPRSRRASIIIPFGLTALAWVGGVGLALCGLAAGVEARAATDDTRARGAGRCSPGVLLGLAVLFRLDLVLGVGLSIDRARRAAWTAPRVKRLADRLRDRRRAVRHPARDRRARVTRSRAWSSTRSSSSAAAAACPIPPSWGHFDGFLQRAGALAQISWPFPALAAAAPALPLVLPAARRDRVRVVAGLARARAEPRVDPRAHAVRRRALRPRDPPAGDAARRLRPLRVGELRRVRVRADRALRVRAPPRRQRCRPAASRSARSRSMLAVLAFVIPAFTVTHLQRLLAADVRHPPRVVQDRARRAAPSTTASPTGPRPRTW